MNPTLPRQNRCPRTMPIVVAMAMLAPVVWLAAVYAQSPAGYESGWRRAPREAGEPPRLPTDVVAADLPPLPPRRHDENAADQVSPAQLMHNEPLLEAMLYEHVNGKSALPHERSSPSSHHEATSYAVQEPTGLLGQMLQAHQTAPQSIAAADASPTPARLPRLNIAAPQRAVVPAHFQDEFDLVPPQSDEPFPLPGPASPLPPENGPADGVQEQPDPASENVDTPAAQDAPPRVETLGEAPEENDAYLQFLRQETILLDPGEHQLDVTFQYLVDTTDFTFAQLDDEDNLQVVTLRRRQRLVLLPVELRYGLTCTTQGFINVPVGWSSDEVIFGAQEDTSDAAGIGDVSLGITEVLMEGDRNSADVLATLAVTAPTGESSFAASLAVPGSNLGSGFWSVSVGLTFIHTYDPIVVYYGLGYQHRFDNTFVGGFDVNPGEIINYRLGVGFAVNPQITLSTSLNGSFITENTVNDILIPGSDQEPISLRVAATIAKDTCAGCGYSVKTVEPFANIGMTNEAIDALIGISWTH